MTLDEIKIQFKKVVYILNMMDGVKDSWKERKINQQLLKFFSICDEVLTYVERIVIIAYLKKKKKKFKAVSCWAYVNVNNETL